MGGANAPIRFVTSRNRCDRGRRPKGAVVAAVAIGGMSVCPVFTPAAPTQAQFYLVQIQQVTGGVSGDTSAQAVQLRMRFPGERDLQFARLLAWDAEGLNPVTIVDFDVDLPNGPKGDNVLIASKNFMDYLDSPIAPDYTMTNLIPASYLAAGRLTYEGDDGAIYWSLSFGGAAYVGETTGLMTNDADGEFGPPFDDALPQNDTRSLLFQGEPFDRSTTNLADYALTLGSAVFTNNMGESATVMPCPRPIDLVAGTDLKDFALLQNCFTGAQGTIAKCCEAADLDDDLTVDLDDYYLLFYDFIGP